MEFTTGVSKFFIKLSQNEKFKKKTRKRGQCMWIRPK